MAANARKGEEASRQLENSGDADEKEEEPDDVEAT